MKFIFLILMSFLQLNASVSILNKKFVNYLDISFSQGLNLMEDFSYGGGSLNSSLGFLYDLNTENSFLLNYSLSYNGPSINYEKNSFLMERSINHSVMLEWQRKIAKSSRIRTHFFYGKDLKKSGAIGDFNDNLYNNNSKGFGIAFDKLGEFNHLSLYTYIRKIEFPNYTDLLLEFKNPSVQSETAGGLYDNNLYRIGLKFKHKNYFISLDYTIQNYISQKIIESHGIYGDDKQKDREIFIKLGIEKKISEFYIFPYTSFLVHLSNQNFLRFKSFTDLSPQFIKNAYDYSEFKIALPTYFKLNTMDVNFSCEFKSRIYLDRPPRDEFNNYILSKKQEDRVFSFNLNVSRKINELASIIFYYTFLNSYSNNDFDIYLPMNYTAHSIGIGYRIKY
ncbi:MAG: hypothetical protein K6357_02295 [Elusimicrobiota bacterium]